jgi:hypothetical protein
MKCALVYHAVLLTGCFLRDSAGEEKRTIHQPETDSVVEMTYPDEKPVVEVTIAGKPIRMVIATEEGISWLRPGAIHAAEIPDPDRKHRWVLAPLKFGTAKIEIEPFRLNDNKAIILPEGCQGVIGHSTLREFCVTFDFSGKKLTLHPAGHPPALTKEEAFALELRERPVEVPDTGIHVTSGWTLLPMWMGEGVHVPFVAATFLNEPARFIPRALLREKLPDLVPPDGAGTFTCREARLGPLSLNDVKFVLTGTGGPQDVGFLNIRGVGTCLITLNYPALTGGIRHAGDMAYSLDWPQVGLVLEAIGADLAVKTVEPDSPAMNAGLRAGDRVRKLAGVELRLPFTPAMKAVLSRDHDPATLTWQRGSEPTVTSVIPARQPEPPSALVAGYERQSQIGWAPEGVSLPLEYTFMGIEAEVQINGKTFRAIVDTGANTSVLTPNAAKIAGIHAATKSSAVASSGLLTRARIGVAARIDLGAAVTYNEPVGIADLPEPCQVLLGMSTLRDFDVRIDPRAKRLTLWPAGKAPAMKDEIILPLTVTTANAGPGVDNPQRWRITKLSVTAAVGGKDLPCTPDTGNGGLLQLPEALAEKLSPGITRRALPAIATGVGLTGTMVSRSARLPSFQFGPDTLTDLNIDLLAMPEDSSLGSVGNIGNGILRHYILTFDFDTGRLRLVPLGTVGDVMLQSTAGVNMGIKEGNVVILSLDPGGAGEKAGLLSGDVLIEIGGIPLKTMTPEQLAALKRLPPGTVVSVKYRRSSGEPTVVPVALQKP